ncbi:MAG: delta-60 repeat domain-containing protein [Flavobacterium sp.]
MIIIKQIPSNNDNTPASFFFAGYYNPVERVYFPSEVELEDGTTRGILANDYWVVSEDGVINLTFGSITVPVSAGDYIRAIVDNPGEIPTNWFFSQGSLGFYPENMENKSSGLNKFDKGSPVKYPSMLGFENLMKNYDLQAIIDNGKVADRISLIQKEEFQLNQIVKGSSYGYISSYLPSKLFDRIYIVGDFDGYGNSVGKDIVAINSITGEVDATFNVGSGFNNFFYAGGNKIAELSDGSLIVVGAFTSYKGVSRNRIVKILPNGDIDTTFNQGTGFTGSLNYMNCVAVDDNDRIYVVGGCTIYNGQTINRICRLLPNGTLDTTFVTGTGLNNGASTIIIGYDGQIIVGGQFTSYKGVSRNRIVSILPNGDINYSFNQGTGFGSGIVNKIVYSNYDEKYYCLGTFTSYNGQSINRLIRLNRDGSIDITFNIGTGLSHEPMFLYVMESGTLLISCKYNSFIQVNGINTKNTFILNEDGSHFNLELDANTYLWSGEIYSAGFPLYYTYYFPFYYGNQIYAFDYSETSFVPKGTFVQLNEVNKPIVPSSFNFEEDGYPMYSRKTRGIVLDDELINYETLIKILFDQRTKNILLQDFQNQLSIEVGNAFANAITLNKYDINGEHPIGVWVDGKTIFRTVIEFILTNTGPIIIYHNNNIKNYVNIKVFESNINSMELYPPLTINDIIDGKSFFFILTSSLIEYSATSITFEKVELRNNNTPVGLLFVIEYTKNDSL